MSSDLPEQRFDSGYQMARVLVTYLDDAAKVRAAIRDEFPEGCRLGLSEIRELRKEHLESLLKPSDPGFRHNDTYYPGEHSARLEVVNKRFLAALEHERGLSIERAKLEGALDSPALRQPAIIDEAWDRETEQAWLQNGELRL